ncbi:recombinational DNA repair protein (RecE pathway) [Desulfosporosinus sp. SB140]|uniref:recombinational DNA repair protein (RecE pathway) n=1 Tax=Desulfosporosinus paludis TaxID=3115649 RepID=UPI00388FDE73
MSNEVAVKEQSMSERFTNKVTALFQSNVGEVALTNFQKRLAQNYFIVADSVLRKAEEKRQKKSEQYRDKVPVVWTNVNMDELAQSVVSAARIGWDPMQDNHVNLIPYKDNATQKYSLTFIPGYRGRELKAKKYGLEVPDDVVVSLVYSNDVFKPHMKSFDNPVEHYEFDIVNPFDRGEIIGGFYYHVYFEKPEKNKLVIMSIKEILKRKPDKASPEFWGGEKDVWKNGKVVGKEQVEGWHDKMCYKTVFIAAYKDITIDSQKIDDDYLRLNKLENDYKEIEVEQTISENANKGNVVDIQGEDVPPDNEALDAEIVEMDKLAEESNNPPTDPGF